MSIDTTIIPLLTTYQLPAIFFGSLLFGETVIITAAVLAAQGAWSLLTVFWVALLGTLVSDVAWFLFGQTMFVRLQRWERYKHTSAPVLKRLQQLTGRRPFLALLFIKFLYGTRVLTIVYLSVQRVRFSTFVLFDAIGTSLWLGVMLAIGWLAGKSVINLLPWVNKAEYLLVGIVVLLLVVKSVTAWINKLIMHK